MPEIRSSPLAELMTANFADEYGLTRDEMIWFWQHYCARPEDATDPLAAILRDPGRITVFGGSVWDRAVAAKADILRRVTELSGARLSRVDIRISGASVREGGRVQ